MFKWHVGNKYNDTLVCEYECTVPNALYGGGGWKIVRGGGGNFLLHEQHFVKIPNVWAGYTWAGTPHKEFKSMKEVEKYVEFRKTIEGDDF